MPMNTPVHPGRFIKSEVIDHFGLTVTRAAKILAVGRQALSALLNGRAALSPEMATRIDKTFGLDRQLLLRMHLAFDLARMRKHEHRIKIERFDPRAA